MKGKPLLLYNPVHAKRFPSPSRSIHFRDVSEAVRKAIYSHHRSRISFSFIVSLFIVFCCSINCWVSRRISPPVKNPETLLTRLCSMKLSSSSCFLFPAWRGQLHNLRSTTWQYLSVCPTTVNGIRLQVNTPRKRNDVRRSMSWIKLFRNWGLWKVNVIHSTLGERPTVIGRLFVLGWLTAVGLAQSVECLTAKREVAGSIPRAKPILRVLE